MAQMAYTPHAMSPSRIRAAIHRPGLARPGPEPIRPRQAQAIVIDATSVTANVIANATARSQKSSRRRWFLRPEIDVVVITAQTPRAVMGA